MAKILDGKKLSRKLSQKLSKKVKSLKIKPKLAILQIGSLPESNTYIRNKIKFAEVIGVEATHLKYPKSVKEIHIVQDILKFNKDKTVHGVMLQLPAPQGFDTERVLESIDPKKDVDGLTAVNTKHLFDGNTTYAFVPATTKGIVRLLEEYKIGVRGKRAVIVGDSALVGRPTALTMLNLGATVTICHKYTKDIKKETRRADILITAVGRPKLIGASHISRGQVIVDIGITITKDKKVLGDVDFDKVKDKVKAITPVPGGVGPMTVCSLFENLIEACERAR